MVDAHRENRRLWNEWSDDFQALWNADTADGGLPPAPSPFGPDPPGGRPLDVLPSVDGKAYVELGCGGGQATVGTAELGVETAVGVDFSERQLRHARRLRDLYGVDARFVQGDVTALPLADDRFGIASSEWAFQMVERLDRALDETHRVLRDGGVFVLSTPHPASEMIDTDRGTVDGDYFATGPRTITIDEDYDATLTVFDRTVADVHNALVDTGFEVRRLVEHRRHDVEENDPEDSESPDVLWTVPESVRFWAVAR